ncbi:IS5 family transposase [Teichococcus wenyumeiae]|uniref:IS5 family transposase n=1 Tax=Teichococcus wenyumeiae TaxID=2478470 RepID=UPI0038D0C8DC
MEPLLPPRPKHPLGCHNPRVPDRAAMDAIFCVLRTGCQWNALRETKLCSSSSAHRRFQEWTKAGVFEAFWRKGLLAYDGLRGIDWSWLALDGAMGKAPLGGGKKTGPNPTDRGKRGVKRSVLTDGRGVPLGAVVEGANRNDHKLMRQTLQAIPVKRPKPTRRQPQHLCLHKGFDYDEPRALAAEFGFTLHLRTRGEEVRARRHARAKARRWVVERTHSWLNRFRSILIRWTRKPANDLALLHLACGIITWRHALPG